MFKVVPGDRISDVDLSLVKNATPFVHVRSFFPFVTRARSLFKVFVFLLTRSIFHRRLRLTDRIEQR